MSALIDYMTKRAGPNTSGAAYMAAKYGVPALLGGGAGAGVGALAADEGEAGPGALAGGVLGAIGGGVGRVIAPHLLNHDFTGSWGQATGEILEGFPRIVSGVMKGPGSLIEKIQEIGKRLKLQAQISSTGPTGEMMFPDMRQRSSYDLGKTIGVGTGLAAAPLAAGYAGGRLMGSSDSQNDTESV